MNKFHNWSRRITLGIVITIVLIFTSLLPNLSNIDFASANENPVTVSLKDIPKDAFVVLEIVPNIKYSEFGYLVGGQEPIDVSAASAAGAFTVDTFGSSMPSPLYTQTIEYKVTCEAGCKKEEDTHVFTSGYYEKVTDGTGNFDMNIYSEDAAGYIYSAGFIKNEGKGNYNWVEASRPEGTKLDDYNAQKVWKQNEPIKVYQKITLKSTEYFRKLCLNNVDKDVRVISVTPAELKLIEESDPDYMKYVDLLYISAKSHMGSGVETLYTGYGKNKDYNSAYTKYEENNDLTWKEAFTIFKRIAIDEDRLPVILDASIANGAWDTNVEKLYFMLRKMNPQVFYNLYLNDNMGGKDAKPTDKVATIINTETGQYNYEDKLYTIWEEKWFKQDPKLLDLYGVINNDSVTQDPANVSVIQNIYTYNGNNALPQVFADLDTNSSVEKMYNGVENPYTKELFDYIEKNKEDTNTAKTSTSPAIAVKYIIGCEKEPDVNVKGTIKILDLEPCNSFTKDAQAFRNMMIHFNGTITIIKQTTATFNGKIEDLNKNYDMIYLGLNCGDKMFTLGSDGLPKYNDNSLYGKIYLHVGDKIIGSTGTTQIDHPVDWLLNGAGDSECRLPGNDITKLKMKDLQDYIAGGYPVVVDKNIYNIGTDDAKKRVDQTSNIVQFINTPALSKGRDDCANLFNEDTLNIITDTKTKTKLESYLAIIKPTITMITEPTPYVGDEDKLFNEEKRDSIYINGENPDYRDLDFKFEISDNAVNASNNYTVELYVDRNADGKFSKGTLNSDGTEVVASEKLISKDKCTVGTNEIEKTLNNDFVGAIPWKLVVYNTANPSIRTEQIGLSAIKNDAEDKKTIRVLQIYDENNFYEDNSWLDLSTDPTFIKYTANLNDFKVSFTPMKICDYEGKFKTNKFDKNNKSKTDQLVNNYDMLIFGFANAYHNISNVNGALDNLQYFIDSGKSVLFTHDITSFNNKYYEDSENIGSDTQFGFNFNKMFRGYLSMDRFGARIGNGDLLSYAARDKATKPDGKTTYNAIHGYTTFALRRIGIASSNNQVDIYPDMAYKNDSMLTTKVTKLNNGQITSYPYHIEDDFTCAATHPQYFQLDLEDDNVVVWYCLADDGNKKVNDGFYGKSPNDASNNYYIYNKGNITYSGVGHSKINNDMEVKLFVNTMIAAYKAGYKEPTVEIVNDDVVKTNDGYYLYIDNDSTTDNFDENSIQEIEFVAHENNLLSEDMCCKATLPEGSIADLYAYDSGTKKDEKVTATKTNKESETTTCIKSGNTYKIKYDLSGLNGASSKSINIVVENEKGLQGSVKVTLLKRNLCNLD